MDHHLLAIIEQSKDSDFSSDTEFPTVISGLSEIQVREGSQKKCKSVVFDQTEGGHPKPNPFCKFFFSKIDHLSSNIPNS